jgi:hypothetical protein
MHTFTFHLEGDNDALPALEWVTVRDQARAIELAAKRLKDWPMLRAIEVHDGEKIVSRLERASPTQSGQRREAGG